MKYHTKIKINAHSKNLYWLTVILGFAANEVLDNKAKLGEPSVKVYSTFRNQIYSLSSYDYTPVETTDLIDISGR